MTIEPHGGTLVNRVLAGDERDRVMERAAELPAIRLDRWAASDLELIANGAFSPLTGFMTRDDYESVVSDMRLAGGAVWSLPVVLGVDPEVVMGGPGPGPLEPGRPGQKPKPEPGPGPLAAGREAALLDEDGELLGTIIIEEIFSCDPVREAELVYRTTDPAHPGVARVYARGRRLVGGPVWLVRRRKPAEFAGLYLDPAETRRVFRDMGWRRVAAFQTRNPVHRAHEYIQKCALEICDGLFLNPLVGATKDDDVPAAVRVECYRALLEGYFPAGRVFMSAFPAAMRYAGPREAIFHAIVRKNYGATHFIVGRDHAGVGNYYGTYDAQLIFDKFSPGELGITPLFFEHSFYCRACGGMASDKTCPHGKLERVALSGTAVRQMLEAGQALPEEFTRAEVAGILIQHYQKRNIAAGGE